MFISLIIMAGSQATFLPSHVRHFHNAVFSKLAKLNFDPTKKERLEAIYIQLKLNQQMGRIAFKLAQTEITSQNTAVDVRTCKCITSSCALFSLVQHFYIFFALILSHYQHVKLSTISFPFDSPCTRIRRGIENDKFVCGSSTIHSQGQFASNCMVDFLYGGPTKLAVIKSLYLISFYPLSQKNGMLQ